MTVKIQQLPADGKKRQMMVPYRRFQRESGAATADLLAPSLLQCTGVVKPGSRAVQVGSGSGGDCLCQGGGQIIPG
eukprot:11822991-Ditylum_brightwellii.AAC.1